MRTMHGSVAVSGSTPVVVFQQATESFAALDFANLQSDCGSRLDQLVIEPLMIPLRVVMLDVITNGCLERSPAKEDHAIEAL